MFPFYKQITSTLSSIRLQESIQSKLSGRGSMIPGHSSSLLLELNSRLLVSCQSSHDTSNFCGRQKQSIQECIARHTHSQFSVLHLLNKENSGFLILPSLSSCQS